MFQLVDWLIDIGLFKTDDDSECAGLLQTSHLSQHLYLFLRIFRTYEKQNALNFPAHIVGDFCGESGFQEQFLQVQRRFKGGEMITATGNRMPLLKTASHDTACESVASLTFFSPQLIRTPSTLFLSQSANPPVFMQ